MRSYLLISFLLLLRVQLPAQIETYADYLFEGNSYNVFVVKVDSESVKKMSLLENKGRLPHHDFLTGLNDSLCFLINAGITDSLCRPLGYWVLDGQQVQPVNTGDGWGNFYLKPNGLLLFTANDIVLCEPSQGAQYPNVRGGTQSGPMLLSNGTVHPLFNPASTNKYKRCGVGSFINPAGDKFIVFAISNTPVSFYNFALFFRNRFGCTNALCLESAGCTMSFPGCPASLNSYNGVVCNYIYYKF